jgi:hypothetical protein
MQAFGRNQISVQVSVFRRQVKKTQDLNPNASSQETGPSFLRYEAALWVVFIILNMPIIIFLGKLGS